MSTTNHTTVTEQEACILISRAGDLKVSCTADGNYSADEWLAALARMELESLATSNPDHASIDWVGLWSLAQRSGFRKEAQQVLEAKGLDAFRSWTSDWFKLYGLPESVQLYPDSPSFAGRRAA